jgi:hypothetical protein
MAETVNGRDAGQLYRIYRGLDPVPVGSSNVESLAWDDATKTLFVRFLSGALYAYAVPATVATAVMTAPSKGRAVYDILRGGDGRRGNRRLDLDHKYPAVKVE